MVSINRQIGSIFIVIGTEVGGGILALPILIAHLGFPIGCVIMFIAWLLMTYTALLICEVNLSVEDGAGFAGMAKRLLGSTGQFTVWFSFLMLLYTAMIAYISAAGSVFNANLHVGQNLIALIFVIFLGVFVILGTAVVDWVNRILLSFKLIVLLFVCAILLHNMHLSYLVPSFLRGKAILATIPVFITAFTSHIIIPPLVPYLRSDAKVLTRVIIIGSVIPLLLYVIWVAGILGVIPFTGENSFISLFARTKDANIGDILNLLKTNLHSELFYIPILLFSNISVTTSFLGVSFALYHFLIDGLKLKKLPKLQKITIAGACTFVIPLLVVWFFPNIFIKVLGYLGLFCSILLIVIPFFMIRKLKENKHIFKIRFTDNAFLVYTSLILGILVIIIQILPK
jgi:tyrosine-specific transport protein